jgi:hypothetical protein
MPLLRGAWSGQRYCMAQCGLGGAPGWALLPRLAAMGPITRRVGRRQWGADPRITASSSVSASVEVGASAASAARVRASVSRRQRFASRP